MAGDLESNIKRVRCADHRCNRGSRKKLARKHPSRPLHAFHANANLTALNKEPNRTRIDVNFRESTVVAIDNCSPNDVRWIGEIEQTYRRMPSEAHALLVSGRNSFKCMNIDRI